MYVCGPTVYNYIHIGNGRSTALYDVLFRVLRQLYPKVTYARNFTDVDDKINAAAAEAGVDISAITEKYIEAFNADMMQLGNLEPNLKPRATQSIDQIIKTVNALIERGHAYESEGHVLFSVDSMPNYGSLSKRSTDDMVAGARVEVASYKKNPMDFVLWKPPTSIYPAGTVRGVVAGRGGILNAPR